MSNKKKKKKKQKSHQVGALRKGFWKGLDTHSVAGYLIQEHETSIMRFEFGQEDVTQMQSNSEIITSHHC